jgi:hypothetical protein
MQLEGTITEAPRPRTRGPLLGGTLAPQIDYKFDHFRMNVKSSQTPNRKFNRKETTSTRPGTQKAAKRKHATLEKGQQASMHGGFKNTALKSITREVPEQTLQGTQIFTNY